MEPNIWTELMLQGGVVAAGVFLLTEFLPFGASGNHKRGMAVLYSMILTFTAYLVGAIKLPEVVAVDFQDQVWPKFVVLAVVAVLTAAETMLAHAAGATLLKKK